LQEIFPTSKNQMRKLPNKDFNSDSNIMKKKDN
jgi:hypothetical protein